MIRPVHVQRSLLQPAAVLGWLAMLTIGWTGLLIPSLIRSIKEAFGQTDAGIGLVFLLYAVAYAAASFVGGPLTERLGRRTVLTASALLHGAGIVSLGLAPSWELFVILMIPAGFGAGSLDGGANGLFLDLFRTGRGRAMNLLQVFFSIAALSAPLVIGRLIEAGVAWPVVMVGSGVVPLVLGAALWVIPMPSGRSVESVRADRAAAPTPSGDRAQGRSLSTPLVLLGIGIAAYVASEVGVSNWLVRFLEPAPLSAATLALSLFWAGIGLGRLVSSAIADRFDHVRFTAACAAGLSIALVGAVAVPALPVSIALFAVAGAAMGPIFPMIVALGGERYPERSAAVSGLLIGCAVVGGMLYPPLMGVLSVTVGLTAAMFGTAVMGALCAAALVAFDRNSARQPGGSAAGRPAD